MTADGDDRPVGGERARPADEERLDAVLEELTAVTEPVMESVEAAPAVGIVVAGPMLPAVDPAVSVGTGGRADRADLGVPEVSGARSAGNVPSGPDSVRGGLLQAGPVAVAGLVVNGAAALVVVAVARLVSTRSYGEIAQLLGLFFIVSMPGSAVLVGVVRRISGMVAAAHGDRIRPWVRRVHRTGLIAIVGLLVVVAGVQGWLARALSVPDDGSVFLILMAGGIWVLLCVDRGLLQAHRSYNQLAGNLLVEGGVRTVLVLGLVGAHLGVVGYAAAVFVGEVVAAAHAHWLAGRAWVGPGVGSGVGSGAAAAKTGTGTGTPTSPAPSGNDGTADDDAARRRLAGDVAAAFCGLALLGLLQNVDVLLVGRLDHHNVGPYAAISVASKALVFGALALGAYLLPEATIRWNQGGHAVRQMGVTLIFLAVPAAVLLVVSVFLPKWFLTLVFGARLSAGASGFAYLVGAMICLSFTVLVTNYLFGTGSRWIVWLLAAGAVAAAGLVASAHGAIVATARADLLVQAGLAATMGVSFVAVHLHHHDHLRERLRQLGRSRVAQPS